MSLPDVQNSSDSHINIPINKVGVKHVKLPFSILQRDGSFQNTVGDFSLYVNLKKQYKGTHMSRFIIELQRYLNLPINSKVLFQLGEQLCDILEAETSFIDLQFDYFLHKKAPVTEFKGIIDYKCGFQLEYNKNDPERQNFYVYVNVPITSLCPCSKEISQYGAHNQRSNVTVKCRCANDNELLWLEDLIDIVEKSGSCEIYSVLKRDDEKYVTERAYENPVFCEDIVRNIADNLNKLKNIEYYHIISENHESIHNHVASAEIKHTF